VSIGLAAASYAAVEHPAREFGRRLSRRAVRQPPIVLSDPVEVGVA
jgi:peptidoglycan/LPS O-acetylase OafA/YrhL